jgi:hypothetical protein
MGASSGIGRATAPELTCRGAAVVVAVVVNRRLSLWLRRSRPTGGCVRDRGRYRFRRRGQSWPEHAVRLAGGSTPGFTSPVFCWSPDSRNHIRGVRPGSSRESLGQVHGAKAPWPAVCERGGADPLCGRTRCHDPTLGHSRRRPVRRVQIKPYPLVPVSNPWRPIREPAAEQPFRRHGCGTESVPSTCADQPATSKSYLACHTAGGRSPSPVRVRIRSCMSEQIRDRSPGFPMSMSLHGVVGWRRRASSWVSASAGSSTE